MKSDLILGNKNNNKDDHVTTGSYNINSTQIHRHTDTW